MADTVQTVNRLAGYTPSPIRGFNGSVWAQQFETVKPSCPAHRERRLWLSCQQCEALSIGTIAHSDNIQPRTGLALRPARGFETLGSRATLPGGCRGTQ